MINVEQIRAARAMLGMKQGDLAHKAGISVSTLNNIERGVQTDPKISTLRAIQHALEQDGIEFSETETGKVGVFLHASAQNLPRETVLVIDPNEGDRALYRAWLARRKGFAYTVLEADNARDGYDLILRYNPACVVADQRMYGAGNGLRVFAEHDAAHAEMPPLVLVTATAEQAAQHAGEDKEHSYVSKRDLTREMLYSLLDNCLRTRQRAA